MKSNRGISQENDTYTKKRVRIRNKLSGTFHIEEGLRQGQRCFLTQCSMHQREPQYHFSQIHSIQQNDSHPFFDMSFAQQCFISKA